jgi:diguanylate cyclase (GGDEF)-like protein
MSQPIDDPSSAQARHRTISARLQALDMPGALAAARAALDAANGPVELAAARYWLAKCHYVAGEIDVAIVLAAEASAAAAQAASPVWLARAQTVEARCLEAAGETQAALDLALLALQEVEGADPHDTEACAARQAAVAALGVVYLSLDELALAMEWCQRSVELARLLPDQTTYGAAVDTVACVHSAFAAQARDAGDAVEAERLERLAIACSTEAVAVARGLGHVDYETTALLNLAESLTLVGETPRALELLLDWTKHHPHALPRQWAHQRDSLGLVYLASGRAPEAVSALEESLGFLSESDSFRAVVTEHLSTALERCGRWCEALAQYKAFHAVQSRLAAERARRSARVAAARLDIERERARTRQLASSNTALRRRAEDLARQANEDVLTGLPNRRQVDTVIAALGRSVSAALLDVDHFKRVNDGFSHAVGDLVLKQLADIMRATCRARDLPARFGGEEFLVLFDGAADADVMRAAERLRAAVESFDWHTIAPGLQVTVSIGLARAAEAVDGTQLLALADQRLYTAKRQGRNRVVSEG